MALVAGSQPWVLEGVKKKKEDSFPRLFLVNKVSLSADSSVKVTCQGLAIFCCLIYTTELGIRPWLYLCSKRTNDVTACFHSWPARALHAARGVPVDGQRSSRQRVAAAALAEGGWQGRSTPVHPGPLRRARAGWRWLGSAGRPAFPRPSTRLCTGPTTWFNAHKQSEIRSFLKILFIKKNWTS